jgi:hypothetical protein
MWFYMCLTKYEHLNGPFAPYGRLRIHLYGFLCFLHGLTMVASSYGNASEHWVALGVPPAQRCGMMRRRGRWSGRHDAAVGLPPASPGCGGGGAGNGEGTAASPSGGGGVARRWSGRCDATAGALLRLQAVVAGGGVDAELGMGGGCQDVTAAMTCGRRRSRVAADRQRAGPEGGRCRMLTRKRRATATQIPS